MTREEKDKLLALMGEERNSYSEHIKREIDRLYGKIEGADYILNPCHAVKYASAMLYSPPSN